MSQLVISALGAALRTDVAEMLLVALLLDGETVDRERLASRLQAQRATLGPDPAGTQRVGPHAAPRPAPRSVVQFALDRRVPLLRRPGMLDA